MARCREMDLDEEEEAKIFAECPIACGVHLHGPQEQSENYRPGTTNSYLVRIERNDGIPDGVYPGVVRRADSGDKDRWVLRITISNRTGVDLDALGASGAIRFFRRAWFDSFTLTPIHKHQNHM